MLRIVTCSVLLAAATTVAAAEKPITAQATMRDASGTVVGSATFTEKDDGVEVSVKVAGLPPGKHGIHLHEKGACDPPGFSTAGGHFNPTTKRHGAKNPEGKHAGDLPNLDVKPDGTGELTAVAAGATLSKGAASLLKEQGTALMIHAGPDDEKTDPSGNSGDRIACGIVIRK
ncbi:superoxide dismutase family protein [Geobacter sp. DSM 9736]|uniref:superoxide dismutase family protein n=1 Tax=Geobacter sp. DSM 9736 TaxID=1277350 RepID=UPI000B513322|nr:superoxide dismutase family protein [Geobacter sp. DSM 9736]SNB47360.1 superoxide dismutase, Cu-Zn family [Geobacter sp. DSM 9736]